MAFYSKDLLSSPLFRTFWKAAALPGAAAQFAEGAPRGFLHRRNEALEASHLIAQGAETLRDILEGRMDASELQARLRGVAVRKRGKKVAEQAAGEEQAVLLSIQTLVIPSQLLVGLVRVYHAGRFLLLVDCNNQLQALIRTTPLEDTHHMLPGPEEKAKTSSRQPRGKKAAALLPPPDIDINLPDEELLLGGVDVLLLPRPTASSQQAASGAAAAGAAGAVTGASLGAARDMRLPRPGFRAASLPQDEELFDVVGDDFLAAAAPDQWDHMDHMFAAVEERDEGTEVTPPPASGLEPAGEQAPGTPPTTPPTRGAPGAAVATASPSAPRKALLPPGVRGEGAGLDEFLLPPLEEEGGMMEAGAWRKRARPAVSLLAEDSWLRDIQAYEEGVDHQEGFEAVVTSSATTRTYPPGGGGEAATVSVSVGAAYVAQGLSEGAAPPVEAPAVVVPEEAQAMETEEEREQAARAEEEKEEEEAEKEEGGREKGVADAVFDNLGLKRVKLTGAKQVDRPGSLGLLSGTELRSWQDDRTPILHPVVRKAGPLGGLRVRARRVAPLMPPPPHLSEMFDVAGLIPLRSPRGEDAAVGWRRAGDVTGPGFAAGPALGRLYQRSMRGPTPPEGGAPPAKRAARRRGEGVVAGEEEEEEVRREGGEVVREEEEVGREEEEGEAREEGEEARSLDDGLQGGSEPMLTTTEEEEEGRVAPEVETGLQYEHARARLPGPLAQVAPLSVEELRLLGGCSDAQLQLEALPRRTRQVAAAYKAEFDRMPASDAAVVGPAAGSGEALRMSSFLGGATRLDAASWFADSLMLMKCGALVLDQPDGAYEDILIRPRTTGTAA